MEGRFPNRVLPYVLLAPSLGVILIFLILPSLQALRLSVFELSPFTGRGSFVGLANFRELLGSAVYRRSLAVTFVFAAAVVTLGIAGSLAVAVLASQPFRGLGLYRVAMLWPYALSPAVAGTIWALMFDPATGPVTLLVRSLTGFDPNWMMSGTYALAVIV